MNTPQPTMNTQAVTPIFSEKEQNRINLLSICTQFVKSFIDRYGTFRFSSPMRQYDGPIENYQGNWGYTKYYSFVMIDTTNMYVAFAHSRPANHPLHEWYFPIWNLITGFSKNKDRSFDKMGLKSVLAMYCEEGYHPELSEVSHGYHLSL
jgi:hypothetical protein